MMLGIELDAGLLNAIVAGAVGAGVTLIVGWWSTRKIRSDLRENVDVLVTVARGLEEAFQSGELEFNYDDEGRPAGIVVHLSGTSVGRGSMHANLTAGEAGKSDEGEGAAGLEDDLPLDDELEIKRQRPEGGGEGE